MLMLLKCFFIKNNVRWNDESSDDNGNNAIDVDNGSRLDVDVCTDW